MSKWSVVGAFALLCVLCAAAPNAALASGHRSATGIRALRSEYVICASGQSAEVSGKLVVRKHVRRGRRTVTVDVPINGGVYLQRLAERSGRWITTDWKNTSGSIVRFEVAEPGRYRLLHPQTRSTLASQNFTVVEGKLLAIGSLGPVSATHDASGDVFVTLGADFQAPAGMITTATPGAAIFVVIDGTGLPIDALLGLGGSPLGAVPAVADPLFGISHGYLAVLRRSGNYRYGFTVPAAQADDTFVVSTMFLSTGPYILPASKAATFTPSAFLP